MSAGFFRNALRKSKESPDHPSANSQTPQSFSKEGAEVIGLIAGYGPFPIAFARGAKAHGAKIVAACHVGETDPAIEAVADDVFWVKVGELGKIISTFVAAGATKAAMAGGIHRPKFFGGVKLDPRGAMLLAKIRSAKDDVIMRGIADELAGEGIEVISCTAYMEDWLAPQGLLTKARLTEDDKQDIEVGISAIKAMSSEDIGQLVVVREGVVVAVEAAEGSDAAIKRGGELGGRGTVVVKFAKPTQDMRFDVPTVGVKTIETMVSVKAKVLALEAGRTLIVEPDKVVQLANKHKISVVGCEPLI